MNDTLLYEKVKEIINQYNSILFEYGIELTIHRRSFSEATEYKFPAHHGIIDVFEYIVNKKIEEKKYRDIPNRYKLLVLQVKPIKKTAIKKKDYKKYVFLVYQFSRTHKGDSPIEWQAKEQSVIERLEKRLKKILKRSKNSTSNDWCYDTLWDAVRYSFSQKYGYIENYCGKSRCFWEVLWACVFIIPVLLFAICGLICSIIRS